MDRLLCGCFSRRATDALLALAQRADVGLATAVMERDRDRIPFPPPLGDRALTPVWADEAGQCCLCLHVN